MIKYPVVGRSYKLKRYSETLDDTFEETCSSIATEMKKHFGKVITVARVEMGRNSFRIEEDEREYLYHIFYLESKEVLSDLHRGGKVKLVEEIEDEDKIIYSKPFEVEKIIEKNRQVVLKKPFNGTKVWGFSMLEPVKAKCGFKIQ